MIPPEDFDRILADISTGMPAYKAVEKHNQSRHLFYALIAADTQARDKYARAKHDGLEAIADDMLRIADECREGSKTKETKDGFFIETGDMVERSRLQVDTRKWLLSKLAPKKYGEASSIELSGSISHNLLEEAMIRGRKRLADPDAT